MTMNNGRVTLTWGCEKANVYAEGGITFRLNVAGPGWIVDDEPSDQIVALALAVRAVAFPDLAPLTVDEVQS
jgi:hypothetical protein